LARAWQAEQRDPVDQARLEAVSGALDRMASALVEAVSGGLAGVERDLAAQIAPSGLDLASITTPVPLRYGRERQGPPPPLRPGVRRPPPERPAPPGPGRRPLPPLHPLAPAAPPSGGWGDLNQAAPRCVSMYSRTRLMRPSSSSKTKQ